MAFLFDFRSTDSSILNHISNPIGSDNDFYLQKSASEANLVIACWGNPGRLLNRDKEVISLISNLYYLRQNKNGRPHHSLYLSKETKPSPDIQ